MGKPLNVSIDEEVHDGLMKYLEREFGNTKGKSLVVNRAIRDFLERKKILPANPGAKPDQASLFKE